MTPRVAPKLDVVDRLLAAADGGPQLAPITDDDPRFDVGAATRRSPRCTIAASRRVGAGRPQDRLHQSNDLGALRRRPAMWSMLWDRTVVQAPGGAATVDVAGLHEPRIEPEVVFGLASPPRRGDARAMLDAVEWIAAGFEIVHSVFPGWKFKAPDCTAAFGLHGRLVVGPPTTLDADRRDAIAALLPTFRRRCAATARSSTAASARTCSTDRRTRSRTCASCSRRSRRFPRSPRRDRHDRDAHRRVAGGAGDV
jgi:2-keto-4-pentenoate hydratase